MVTVAQAVAQSAAFVGIVAGFWHITWVAGVTFLVSGLVAVGIHSAGFWRLEETQSRRPRTAVRLTNVRPTSCFAREVPVWDA
jgi:hypothetical protein